MGPAILLALAGLASGMVAAWPVPGAQADSVSDGLFGLVLAGYLWLHDGIRSSRLAVVVFAPIVGHYVMAFVGIAGLFVLFLLTNHLNPTPWAAMGAAGAAGAAAIAVAFLRALPSKRDQLGLEIACCAIVGWLVGSLWQFVEFPAVHWLVRLHVWNGAVAGVLGLVAHLRSRPAAVGTTALRVLAGAGIAGICALFAFGDALRAAAPHTVPVLVESSSAAAAREARAKSLSEAPPAVDLPAIPSIPARRLFTPEPIAGFACYPPHDSPLTPDSIQVDSIRLRKPARHEYHLQCYPEKEGPQAPGAVHVWIVQYPNAAWARYDLRSIDGYQGLIQDRSTVKRIMKRGRPIFAGKTQTYWSSGDKVITIGGDAPPATLDAFIETYLTRYPSTLEPGFDLPYLPSR